MIYTDLEDGKRRIISAWRSERHERRHDWKKSERKNRAKAGTDWEALRSMSDEDICAGIDADPDAQATDAAFWKHAKVVMPQPKQTVTMRSSIIDQHASDHVEVRY